MVVTQTIQQVVPPLLASLKVHHRDPVAGTAELILSFVAAFEHVPSNRRLKLYTSLVTILGEEDFLYVILATLINKYENEKTAISFGIELASRFEPHTQLTVSRR